MDGELVYAIGDVHGCYDLLVRLLELIAEDARRRAGDRRPVMIFLGDYLDRGPDSAAVLSSLVWLSRRSPMEVHFLKGNHEQMLLGYLDDPVAYRAWLRAGGAETLRSYGVDAPAGDALDDDHRQARDALLDAMPAAHLHLLQRLQLSLQIGDYAFVHAGVRPGVPLRKQDEADLLWIREDFLSHERRHEKIIVHGHSWRSAEPELLGGRIAIDTGAYETGVLTAIRLEDRDIEVFQAGVAD